MGARISSTLLAFEGSKAAQASANQRTRQTQADLYFMKHKCVPAPPTKHAVLHRFSDSNNATVGNNIIQPGDLVSNEVGSGVLIIGDIHGCVDEFRALLKKAVEENNNNPFEAVVLVGDLVNKGPASAEVVRVARLTPGIFAVRGNHDEGSLAAALGDEERRKKKKYQWVMDGENIENECISDGIYLSDDDIMWMSDLPYTIRIPWILQEDGTEVTVVHAGLVPNMPLEQQAVDIMLTVRELIGIPSDNEVGNIDLVDARKHQQQQQQQLARELGDSDQTSKCMYQFDNAEALVNESEPQPWARIWRGPQHVVFGHDARRGLQQCEHATGLDTGCVYGGSLTGIILPRRKLVSVAAAKEYCPR
eukprot:CAMPEP_0116019194 /NCGR_PEP_ID=MMETSP0321-20121206/9089_1 /TAXON_ID=163516 /ORGANISM="Leptocylindrus danicus var. danicus, Strain B650" /LENGTH=362 /DNA_ID=CAMNT_0003489713 /DNA_START=87 /DNA_END=1175 /DNA_ORIENTATION=+